MSRTTGTVGRPVDFVSRPADARSQTEAIRGEIPCPTRISVDRRTSILLTLLWAWVVLPRVIQSLVAPKHRRSAGIDYGGYTASASMTQNLLRVVVFAFCALLIAGGIADARRRSIIALTVFLAPWVFLVLRDLYTGRAPNGDAMLYPVLTVTIWVLSPGPSSLRIMAHLTALACLISISMALLRPSSALFRTADGTVIAADKQIIPSGMLTGFLTQPNNLGQLVVLGLPAIALLRVSAVRHCYSGLAAFTVVWTASRSSLYALAITGAAALVVSTRHRARRAAGSTAIAAAFGAVCVLPFVTHSPSAYSGRGLIWQSSLPAWQQQPWLGEGADWYRRLAATSSSIMSTAFHGHNQLVQLLVTGGLCYAVLTAIALLLASRAAVRLAATESVFGVLFMVALAGTCLLEVSLSVVDNMALLPFVLVPLAVLSFADTGGPAHSPGRAVASAGRQPPARCSTVRNASSVFVLRDADACKSHAESAPQVAFATTPLPNAAAQHAPYIPSGTAGGQQRRLPSERHLRADAAERCIGEQDLCPRPPVAGA